MVLIPQVVDAVRGKKSPLLGEQVQVIAAGGIFDGRGLAAALSLGASGVWVGTRFVASFESKAPPRHVNAILEHESDQTIRSTIYTGRPMRVLKTDYNANWEEMRKPEMLDLQSKGIIAATVDFKKDGESQGQLPAAMIPLLMGQAIGAIKKQQPAAEILNDMVTQAAQILKSNSQLLIGTAKL
jgi:NAD(P)H-dependent flavin oxidoreductase YrpB (nitropropane dioxygenase family)